MVGGRILIVEDRHLVADELAYQLRAMSFEVVGPVASVQKALELARRERLDGALLDLHVEGGTVEPVLEELLQRSIPFLLLSGFGAAASLPEEFRRFPLLSKPFGRAELEQALRSVLDAAEDGPRAPGP